MIIIRIQQQGTLLQLFNRACCSTFLILRLIPSCKNTPFSAVYPLPTRVPDYTLFHVRQFCWPQSTTPPPLPLPLPPPPQQTSPLITWNCFNQPSCFLVYSTSKLDIVLGRANQNCCRSIKPHKIYSALF
jgi:hypothetical protein